MILLLGCTVVKKIAELGNFEVVHVASHYKDPNAPQEHVDGNRIADDYANKGKKFEDYTEHIDHI